MNQAETIDTVDTVETVQEFEPSKQMQMNFYFNVAVSLIS